MKILIIQQKMIGDVLVSTILCENIKLKYPNAQVDYMIYKGSLPVVEGNKFIDNIIIFTEKHRNNKIEFLKFLFQIRKKKYDIVIDAYSKLESWLTVLFSGAKQKISYDKKWRKFLYTDNIPNIEKQKSNVGLIIEKRLSLLNTLNFNKPLEVFPKVYLTEKENNYAVKILEQGGLDLRKKTVMISIIGSTENKTYPLSYMSKIVDFIVDKMDVNILFNYIPNQKNQAKLVYDKCKNTTKEKIFFDVLGNNLRTYISIVNQCAFIIGNDSGAINIAKALKKPSFIIFSPWIDKKYWATFEDGVNNLSVHLKDFKPLLFKNKSKKWIKNNTLNLYSHFKPEYIYNALDLFLDNINSSNDRNYNIDNFKKEYNEKKLEKISGLIITYNEEKYIDKVIKNLNFVDELVIVDSFSTDKTIEIIKKYKHIKLIQNHFINFSEQRNFALKQVKYDWVLFIDVDEYIDKKLKDEINNFRLCLRDYKAFQFRRLFYFKDKPLRFSGTQNDKVFRFFNKNYAIYNSKKYVHETLIVNGNTKIFKNKLIHYSYQTYEKHRAKLDSYARLKAKELYKKQVKPNFFHFYIKPLYRFVKNYFIQLGILDGKKGFILSKLNAYGVKQRYVELNKLYKKRS